MNALFNHDETVGVKNRRIVCGVLWVTLGFLAAGCVGEASRTELQANKAEQRLTSCVTFKRTSSGAVADSMISDPPRAQNYGSGPILRVGGKDESLLNYDLSSIPSAAVISRATLTLYANGSAGTNPINIHRVTSAWTETAVTFTNFGQQFSPTVSATIQPSSPNAFKSADVTELVTSWVTGALTNYGMLLETAGNQKTIFVSSDADATAQRPALEVCYSIVVDHCASSPCQHGSCVNDESGYTCVCEPGWDGTTCETNMHECNQQPCQNDGSCTNIPNGYVCTCAAGYAGVNCETLIDNCAVGPCQNEGVCTNGVNSYACSCLPGFVGTNCETEIDECDGSPCVNGTCQDLVNGYLCDCAFGYTGANCEVNVDECVDNRCVNGSTCVDGIGEYTCACLPDYTGSYCETNINDCAGNPCFNGGACVDGVNSYSCQCLTGYAGQYCETDINDCVPNPCENGGSCIDGVAGHTCSCIVGTSGPNCETAIVPPVTNGLLAHYNARVPASVAIASGSVSAWNDLSGHNYHLYPAGSGPVYSSMLLGTRPGLDFSFGDRLVADSVPLSSNVSVFVAFQQRSPGQWGPIMHHGDRDSDWSLEQSGFDYPNTSVLHWQSVNDNYNCELTFAANTNYVAVGRIDGTTRTFYAYNSSANTATSTSGNSISPGYKTIYVGTSNIMEASNAYIGEIVYYNRALNDTERDLVVAYLRTQWGI